MCRACLSSVNPSFIVARQKPHSTHFGPATLHRPSYASAGLGRVYSFIGRIAKHFVISFQSFRSDMSVPVEGHSVANRNNHSPQESTPKTNPAIAKGMNQQVDSRRAADKADGNVSCRRKWGVVRFWWVTGQNRQGLLYRLAPVALCDIGVSHSTRRAAALQVCLTCLVWRDKCAVPLLPRDITSLHCMSHVVALR